MAYTWHDRLKELHRQAHDTYGGGNRSVATFFGADDGRYLRSIGATAMELYDFAEDGADLDWETAFLIVAARRDYFISVQHREWSQNVISMEDLPPKDAELEGIGWLPRLIAKAEGRLRGELPPQLMYCCGGDRRFFKKYDIHPADFLREVWAAHGDEARIVAYVKGER